MKIGIDLDGVCYDFTAAFCEYAGGDPKSVTKWRFFEDMGFTEAAFLSVCRNAIRQGKMFAEGYLLPGTKEAFDALIEMGHTIHLVTDRCSLDPEDTATIIHATRDWLEDNGLRYETIHYTGDKATVAKELGLDFFIDDKMENFESLIDVTRSYLMDRPWNQCSVRHVTGDALCKTNRVYSWNEFVQKVALETLLSDESYYEESDVESPLTDEVRVTSATGGQKGQKQARIGSIDPQALMDIAKVAGFGEQKYARLNYLNGYDWSLSYDACQRHLHAFWSGEDLDPESGLPHLAHAAWHCAAMLAFLRHGLGTDDRYRKPEEDAA